LFIFGLVLTLIWLIGSTLLILAFILAYFRKLLQDLSRQSKAMLFMFYPWLTKRFPELCLLRYAFSFVHLNVGSFMTEK